MNRILLYGHGGCENHGCEAIVRGTVDIIKNEFPNSTFCLLIQDYKIGIDGEIGLPVNEIILQRRIKKLSLSYFLAAMSYMFTRKADKYFDSVYSFAQDRISESEIALSIGGDNYCYGQHNSLYYLDESLDKRNCKRVLWGCSVEPNSLSDETLIKDLDGFSLIVGREPITVEALKKVLKNAKVILRPDPAFALKKSEVNIPDRFKANGIVGINLSPVVANITDRGNLTYDNYDEMIRYIIDSTNYNIFLVPHVTWNKSNDLEPLKSLYEKYKHTQRVMLIEKFKDCCELKGYISECDMFIGARTHSTIAAYSSCVPCIAVGYSVKAEGIAKQLFGTTDNYVIQAEQLENTSVLTEHFKWLDKNKNKIKIHLERIMPDYIRSAFDAAKELRNI